MKVLLLLNINSGRGMWNKKKIYIETRLQKIFGNVTRKESSSKEDFLKIAKDACGTFDVLIFAGGDGTFNMIVNAIAREPIRPVLGILPTGTLNDASKIFKVRGGIKKALDVIENKEIKKVDIGKANDDYFIFSAALGTFSDIPYMTKTKRKSGFGFFAYYFKALSRLLKKETVKGTITFEDGIAEVFEAPFILIMNSAHIAGFKINPKSDSFDGKMDLFWTEPTIFNSLFRYFLFRKKLHTYKFERVIIRTNSENHWALDGEKGSSGEMKIEVLARHLEVFSL
ncbi:MAG: hypothetical protein GX807_00535 [Erysipelotrichia bacterium]|nr:hypothetical protein [Erysipelotrichia bacterium]